MDRQSPKSSEPRDETGRLSRFSEPLTRPPQMRSLAWIFIFFGAMASALATVQLIRDGDTIFWKGVFIGLGLLAAGLLWMRAADRAFRRRLGQEVEAMIEDVARRYDGTLDATKLASDTWLDIDQATDELDRLVRRGLAEKSGDPTGSTQYRLRSAPPESS